MKRSTHGTRSDSGRNKLKRRAVRPNVRRRLFFAAITFAVILGGYGVGLLFKPMGSENTPTSTVPWYRTQAPPPTLITAPDAPLFPDPQENPGGHPMRPYEEALPDEVYESPAPPPRTVPQMSAPIPPWQRFAAAAPDEAGRPVIVVVIDDMGMDRKRTERTIGLMGPLTLSFLSYAPDLQQQTAPVRAAGHELLVHLSMEPRNETLDAGPNVLRTTLDLVELRRRVIWGLSRFESYVGANNHMGSKFTAHEPGMRVVMEELKDRGLLFLDSRTTANSVGAKLASELNVPFAERNIFLDNVDDLAAVNARLTEVEKFARRRGLVIAIGHTREVTIQALSQWLPGLAAKGFVLAPLSAVVSNP